MEFTSEQLNQIIEEQVKKLMPQYLKGSAFTARKITDTPTDRLQVVSMGYVNMYGSVAGAPKSSVIGQQYFATDLGYPIFKNQNSRWVSPTGSIVG